MNPTQRLTCLDPIAYLRLEDDPHGIVDRIALFLPAAAKLHCGQPHGIRPDLSKPTCRRRSNRLDQACRRQQLRIVDLSYVAALGGDELPELFPGLSVPELFARLILQYLLVGAKTSQAEHLRCQRHDQLFEIGGAAALQGGNGFLELQRVAYGSPKRLIHGADHGRHPASGVAADFDHQPRQATRIGLRLHERAMPYLDVEHDRVGAGCKFF